MSPRGLISLIVLFSVSLVVTAQETDTLTAAGIMADRGRPVVKPVEEVYLQDATAVPAQISDVIRRFTGVQVKDYGGIGGLKTVNVRSLGSEHTGVFLDGIQIDNTQNMQVDIGRFSTDGISTVSLYSGQKTKRLQTAREYVCGAAVYLDSEAPSHLEKSSGTLRLRGGSFGTFNPSLRLDNKLKNVILRTSAEFLSSNGEYRYPYFDTTLTRRNGDITSIRLENMLFGRTGRGNWRVRAYYYNSDRGFPGPIIRRSLGFPFSSEREQDCDAFIQGGWQQEWSDRYATALRFKVFESRTHYNTHPERNPMAMPYNVRFRQGSQYLSLAQSVTLNQSWSTDASVDIQRNTLDSKPDMSGTPRRFTLTAAVATRLLLERFRASAHIAYLNASDSFLSSQQGAWHRSSTDRSSFMPSLSLYYAPLPSLEFDFFAKKSYRLPSFNDLYYKLIGNINLEPESAAQYGLDIHLGGSRGTWSGNARLSPYINLVSNKIMAIPAASQFRWTMLNVGKADIKGMDAKMEGTYSRKSTVLNLTLRYSYQQALDHSDPGSLVYGNQLPYIPLHSGSVDFSATLGDWTMIWATSITGERWSRTANTDDYYLEPWSTSDVSLLRKLPFPVKGAGAGQPGITVGIICRNIFDYHYQIVQGYPMPGFNAMVSIELIW